MANSKEFTSQITMLYNPKVTLSNKREYLSLSVFISPESDSFQEDFNIEEEKVYPNGVSYPGMYDPALLSGLKIASMYKQEQLDEFFKRHNVSDEVKKQSDNLAIFALRPSKVTHQNKVYEGYKLTFALQAEQPDNKTVIKNLKVVY